MKVKFFNWKLLWKFFFLDCDETKKPRERYLHWLRGFSSSLLLQFIKAFNSHKYVCVSKYVCHDFGSKLYLQYSISQLTSLISYWLINLIYFFDWASLPVQMLLLIEEIPHLRAIVLPIHHLQNKRKEEEISINSKKSV